MDKNEELQTKPVILNKEILVPFTLIATIIAAVWFIAMMYSKIESNEKYNNEHYDSVVEQLKEIKSEQRSSKTTIYTDYDSIQQFCRKLISDITK